VYEKNERAGGMVRADNLQQSFTKTVVSGIGPKLACALVMIHRRLKSLGFSLLTKNRTFHHLNLKWVGF